MAGYSKTPLAKKLGFKENFRVRVKRPPENYLDLVNPLPDNVHISTKIRKNIDIWHLFTKSRQELTLQLQKSRVEIRQNGMIWVSWPKKSSKVKTDITEDVIREIALPLGLVDVKVCAIDEVWSGLKLVIRKELRR